MAPTGNPTPASAQGAVTELLSAPSLDGWARLSALMAHPPGSHSKLKDPPTPQCKNDDGTKDHGEQERNGQR